MPRIGRSVGIFLEWTCHGVPWLGICVLWLLSLWVNGVERTSLDKPVNFTSMKQGLSSLLKPDTSLFPDAWTKSFCLFSSLIIDLLLVGLIKVCVRRPRPREGDITDMRLTVATDLWSFPSGHASRAFLLFWLIPRMFPLSSASILALGVWSTLICVSRYALARHFTSDILAGAVLGFLEYQLVMFINWPTVVDSLVMMFYSAQKRAEL